MSRSFTGCKRCKARRQKCDEQRPVCGRCQAAGSQCQYAMQLQWGGRAFSRSRFGACVGDGMQKVEYSPGEFIYTTSSSNNNNNNNALSPSSPSNLSLTRPVDPFSSLSSEHKSLLHHFIHDASQITACHSGMQTDICRMLIPMALQTPSLLYATTALSAIHLQAVNNRSETVKSAPDIARFMALSLEHFRRELQNPSTKGSDALLATARTLCLAEIHSGAIHPNSWRAHIEGAKALMGATATNQGSVSAEGFRWYLDRWYRSIVSLTALTGNGPPIGGVNDQSGNAMHQEESPPDYLDDYWGFTVHLSAIFRGIGAAAWRRHQILQTRTLVDPSEDISIQNEAASLESSVRELMDRDAGETPAFYPGVIEGLSAECIRQFILCNEAFQHSALIQINRRLRKTPSSSPAVQQSVRRILDCTAQIGPQAGPSPWVMLTTPLFIAGCEARENDREQVRELLAMLHDSIRVPNVLQSLKFLEQYWANQLDDEEDWSHFLESLVSSKPADSDNDVGRVTSRTSELKNQSPIPIDNPPLSPASFASSASSLVDEDAIPVGPRDLDRFPQRGPSALPLRLDTSPSASSTDDDAAYGSQFSNGTPLHSRLVSEPFIPVLPSSPSPPATVASSQTAMALHPPTNRPPPLRIDSAGARKASASSFDSKQQLPRTPGNKISNFFGWKAPVTSPGAESSSTEISDGGRSPLASSPMPPSIPSASYAITPATTIPLDNSKPIRNGSLSSANLLDSKLAELENELREISSELAGSIRREMELEDLVERFQSDLPLDTTNRRTSDYFSDSGTSSIRYANDSNRAEDLEKLRRNAEQERAQLKVELSQKWQEERSKRLATESHIQILENQVNQLRAERSELSDLSSRNRELESTVETTRRKLAEERQVKDNFEDLLTAMRVEFQQLRNERDHLRDEVIPQIYGGTYQPPTALMGEIEALKIENASLAQLQGSRFASIAEENDGSPTGLGLSRSNSLARMHSKPNGGAMGLSRSSSLSRPNSVSGKDRDTGQALADRMDDVEMQRDALHQTLRNLLARQAYQAREYEKNTRLMELQLARAQEAGSPRKLGYERDVRNLREEVNHLRGRAEDALEQKWQCEKGLAGLKMDLDRAEQETASLRELLQEHDVSMSENSGAAAEGRDGFAEVLATSSSLESAYQQLQADREHAEASVAASPVEQTGDLTASLSRTEALTTTVQQQLQSNSTLRLRLADAIGKGEKEQQLSATRINDLQSQLKSLEDMLMAAQQLSEEEMGKHEDEIRQLQDNHNDQLQRMKNGARSPAALSPRPAQSPFFGDRSPRLDKTTSGDGVPLNEVVQAETLGKRVRELERLLRNADLDMEEVVGRMNRAQIDVAELQSDRDEALRQTRKLQAEILAERELFKALLSQ